MKRSAGRALRLVLGAALGALPVASPIAHDRAVPADGVSLARRKDLLPAGGDPALVPTLGTLFNLHTGELVPLSDTEPSVERFSDLCADKALLARTPIAPRLLDALRALARESPGARVDVVSGYRSAKRNEMMRKKGHHVASHSQHTLGHAVDFRIEGLGVGDVVKALEAMRWDGGVGRYDGASDRFVHVDVGPKRRWKGE